MRAGGPAAYCGNMGQGVQLLIVHVGTLGHVQLLSEYIRAESTVSTQGQGSIQLLTVGTWGIRGPVAYSGYM